MKTLLSLGMLAAAISALWSVSPKDPADPPSGVARAAAVYVEELPGITSGSASAAQRAANSRVLNAYLGRGAHLRLRAGTRIEIGRTLKIDSGGSIAGDSSSNKPIIYMPADAFDNTNDEAGRGKYASNAVGINFSGELGGSLRP